MTDEAKEPAAQPFWTGPRAATAISIALLSAVVIGVLSSRPDNEASPTTEPSPETSETSDATPTTAPSDANSASPGLSAVADVSTVTKALDDADRNVTITVLGDSTGDAGDEWVAGLARSISDKYQRTVVFRSWNLVSAAYGPAATLGPDRSAGVVTVWNGSAPGQGPFYSQDNLAGLAPGPSDLLIINHGHNFTDAASGAAKEVQLTEVAVAQWKNEPAVAVILQNPRTTRAAAQEANVTALEGAFEDEDIVLVDVHGAFGRESDLSKLLLSDGVHPNAVGQDIWLKAVLRSLDL
jgi:hypothetical protein